MVGKELYSNKISKGKRTYFFDIKKSEQGDLYLKIAERKKVTSGFEHHRLVVFDEDLKDFVDALRNKLTQFKALKSAASASSAPKEQKAYSVDTIRQTYSHASMPWSPADDEKLELLFCEGKSVSELAITFRRNEGSITSRIKKLELKEKYGR